MKLIDSRTKRHLARIVEKEFGGSIMFGVPPYLIRTAAESSAEEILKHFERKEKRFKTRKWRAHLKEKRNVKTTKRD